jgi:hypothetical protein
MKKILLLALCLFSTPLFAQSVEQSGSVTTGHLPYWVTNGVIGDSGYPTEGKITGLGVTASGPGICQNSGPVTGPFNELCFDVTSSGGQLTWNNFAGATGQLSANINGTSYPFPFSLSGTGVVGPSTTVAGDVMCWNNTTGTLAADCNVVFALPGAEMGAQINAAIAKLPASGGIVDARGLTGTQTLSTAINITANVEVVMPTNAVINQSAIITVGQASSLVCQTSGIGQGNNYGQTRFFEVAGSNLAEMVLVSGGMAAVTGCIFDGNKTNNSSAGPNIMITNSHVLLRDITTQNSNGPGWEIFDSIANQNNSCCGTAINVNAELNNGDGLFCENNSDWMISESSFEDNAGNAGAEFENCGGMRFSNYDFGLNNIGIWTYGTAGGQGSYSQIIGSGQFGNQIKQDILFDGTSGNNSGLNTVVGAEFLGSGFRTNATYASIEAENNGYSSMFGSLTINAGVTGHLATYAIYIHGSEAVDQIGMVNLVNQSDFTSSPVVNVPSSSTYFNGNGSINLYGVTPGGVQGITITNNVSAANTYADLALGTGTNNSQVVLEVADNNGSPFGVLGTQSAISSFVFQLAGSSVFGYDSGAIYPATNNGVSLGNNVLQYNVIYGQYFVANGSSGVSCSGTPSSSFASVNGIVTHC